VLIGTYSSIFVASPVVMMLNIRESISGGTVGGSETGQQNPAE
jgi:preprotein translocase subunit SecF